MVDMAISGDPPLGYLLHRVTSALRAEVSGGLRPLGLTFPQYICMRVLSKNPGMSSAELARATNVSPQAMNTVLRGLEDIGAVTRPATVSSGRALPAQLTSAGRALLERTDSAVRVAEDSVLSKLTKPERRQFRDLLAALGTGAPD
jgi:DNA-binding MarR family transcriptional regulator